MERLRDSAYQLTSACRGQVSHCEIAYVKLKSEVGEEFFFHGIHSYQQTDICPVAIVTNIYIYIYIFVWGDPKSTAYSGKRVIMNSGEPYGPEN